MPEVRFDPLGRRSVIVAPERARRPYDPAGCPFCPGHEDLTPPELARIGGGSPGGPGWRMRVFPNRYPIVTDGTTPRIEQQSPRHDAVRVAQPARGAHEVLVFSPDHERTLASLDTTEMAELLGLARDRARRHAKAMLSTSVFVNHGREAGASLSHPHAQLVALPFTPSELQTELIANRGDAGCLICRELRRPDHTDLVVASGDAEAWCPWWSGLHSELLVASRAHRAHFEEAAEDTELPAVAEALLQGLQRLRAALGDPPYNLAIHSAPPTANSDDFHWHIHVWPADVRLGGFERGTGVFVNPTDPADAAALLRSV